MLQAEPQSLFQVDPNMTLLTVQTVRMYAEMYRIGMDMCVSKNCMRPGEGLFFLVFSQFCFAFSVTMTITLTTEVHSREASPW